MHFLIFSTQHVHTYHYFLGLIHRNTRSHDVSCNTWTRPYSIAQIHSAGIIKFIQVVFGDTPESAGHQAQSIMYGRQKFQPSELSSCLSMFFFLDISIISVCVSFPIHDPLNSATVNMSVFIFLKIVAFLEKISGSRLALL